MLKVGEEATYSEIVTTMDFTCAKAKEPRVLAMDWSYHDPLPD